MVDDTSKQQMTKQSEREDKQSTVDMIEEANPEEVRFNG